ncbi:MAG: UbiA family prenyltransferase [Candidatus Marinimicrobia bacterium]|jgi:4-hydroxybenzoate polyprenyltransferase|nr:UbiA family prenyltransferase [Candidatus Neomarinimicrobiota bacterium]MCK9558879.1 UbiA family prenyltransferase [Candidatus Neomarinimicrobiota bacterium]
MLKAPSRSVAWLDYLFIFRPTLFFAVWIITLAGYSGYFIFEKEPAWWSFDFNWKLVLYFTIITLSTGATFILNQLQDIESDKANKKLFLISEEYIKSGRALRIAIVTIIATLLLALILNWRFFVILGICIFFWGYVYNYKPFEWKDKPMLGVLINFISGLCLFLCGWIIAGDWKWMAILYAMPYLLAWTAVAILTTIPDKMGDQKTGKNTISVHYENKVTIWLAFICLALSFALGMYFKDPVISLSCLLASPLFIIMLFKPIEAWVLRSIRYPIMFLALTLCVEFPLFFIVILINFYLCRFYYLSRFNLNYPTFQIEE